MFDPKPPKYSIFDLLIVAIGIFILIYFFPDTFYGAKLK